jgi:DNA-binding CsgD family transcriptional regulator
VTVTVIGRDEELDSVELFLARAQDGPAALVLSGQAGIGKTIVWEAGLDEARTSFAAVLTCRSVEAEASLSFAGLSELLVPVVEEVIASLAPPRRHALEVALLLTDPGEVAADVHAVGLAVLDVLRTLAARGPVLVALDDVQWLDPSSAGVLQIALRRLHDEPIGLLVTVRGDFGPAVPFSLDRSFLQERLTQLSLGPISLAALHSLLRRRLELELTRPELVRLHDATAGNPFFALELGRELARTSARPAPGRSLQIPKNLSQVLEDRLARLPSPTIDVLVHVAALARPTIELVASAVGDRQAVLEALHEAAREGVIEVDEARIRFAHPLLASVCYEQASFQRRREIHRALAGSLTDLEERARHLALAADGPDAAVAADLEAAADAAVARGAPAAAADLAEMAAGLTPGEPALERSRRLRAAHFHRLAGDGERAAALLERQLAEVPQGPERADVLLALVMTHKGTQETRMARCEEALVGAGDDDVRAARILAFLSGTALYGADARAALAAARRALETAERTGDPFLVAVAIARVGQAEAYAAEVTPGLIERGVELEERHALSIQYQESPTYAFARLLGRLGEIERARSLFEELESRASARGDESSRMMVLWPLSTLEWIAGRWDRALEHAAAAHELTEQTSYPHGRTWIGRAKALIECDLGLVEQARASVEESLAFSRANSIAFHTFATLGVLGRLELALGDPEAAARHLRDLPGRLLAGGMNDPTVPVWADTIETLTTLGELDRARAYLDPYELYTKRLGSPLAMEGVLRCRGLLAAAEGNLEAAHEALERPARERGAAPWPLERARTLLAQGTVRRQAGQKRPAREALELALAAFEGLGALLWAERARSELARISGRRAPAEELTEMEARVARLAGLGRSNKEIAAALYIGVSTVEAHLSRVYRKLGVRRAGLAARFPTPVEGAANVVDGAAQP